MRLPRPRTPGSVYRVALVCLGNICRSPMAHVVLASRLADKGLRDRVEVASAGTGEWHIGERMDRIAAATLERSGYDASRHRARLFDDTWVDEYDVLLGMDGSNLHAMRAIAGAQLEDGRLQPYRAYDPESSDDDLDVPDPWGRDEADFDAVLAIVERTSDALVDELSRVVEAEVKPVVPRHRSV